MNPTEASGHLANAVDQDVVRCSDCGEFVDVSKATDKLSALLVLSRHADEFHGGEDLR